jgi:hypothetical protein
MIQPVKPLTMEQSEVIDAATFLQITLTNSTDSAQ